MNIEYTKPSNEEVDELATMMNIPKLAAFNQLSKQRKNEAINNKLDDLKAHIDFVGDEAVITVLKELLTLLRQPT